MDDEWCRIDVGILRVIENILREEALFEVADGFIAMRTMLLHQTRLVLAHATGDFFDGFIERDIHVLTLGVGFDGDVIGAEKDDFGNVPVLLNVENDLGLDDSRIVEMQTLDFLGRVIAEGIGHLLMSHSYSDRQIDVGSLHGSNWFNLGEG